MKKVFIIALSLLLTACASSGPPKGYTGPALYPLDKKPIAQISSTTSQEAVALSVGTSKSGFIPPDRSQKRLAFEKDYPITKPSKAALGELTSHYHNLRMGQAIAIGADFDSRTAGILKDSNGAPLSVTGKVSYRTDEAVSQGVSLGITTGAAMGLTSVAAINQQAATVGMELTTSGTAQVMTAQVVQGVITGLIAGGIHSSMANTAMEEISRAKNFGERVEATTSVAAHVMPSSSPIGPYGQRNTRTPPIYITDSVVKRLLVAVDDENLEFNGSSKVVLITTVGTYRGEKYKKKYPNSSGWEYRVTNLNKVTLPFGSISSWDGQLSIDALINAVSTSKITF
jgi:hypothetical protein